MARVEDMLRKMIRRLDASNEHIKALRSDLVGIDPNLITWILYLVRPHYFVFEKYVSVYHTTGLLDKLKC